MADYKTSDVGEKGRLAEALAMRKQKVANLRKDGINPYAYTYERNAYSADLLKKYEMLKPEEKGSEEHHLAGRIMALRGHGKIIFGNVEDAKGKIQFYSSFDNLGKEKFDLFKKMDVGDIIGIEGTIFRTKRGELTLSLTNFELLAKAIRPLPSKWHGLTDTETRYRQRYLDLIMNPNTKKIFRTRSATISAMREFLDSNGFLEVHTPVLQPIYGGAAARPFKTFHNSLQRTLYLRVATELYLKRLIVGGLEKVYEIGPDFRNESIDTTHNPEFFQMEFYWAYADYNKVMDFCEKMFKFITKKVLGTTKVTYQGTKIDFSKPWERISMVDAIKKYGNEDIEQMNLEELKTLAAKHNLEVAENVNRGKLIEGLFEELAEPQLKQPTFVKDFPREVCPLAKPLRGNDKYAERFEAYIGGLEMTNAYSELNDPEEQYNQFENQVKERKLGDVEAHEMDEDYVRALEYGMPPTGGFGIGIGRLIMLLTDNPSLKEVILFPQMREKGYISEEIYGDETKDTVFKETN